MVSKVHHEVHMTYLLHTVRINKSQKRNVEIEIREMVSFELGKGIEKDVFFFLVTC